MATTQKFDIKNELVLQGLFLSDDELLVYKDETGEYHVLLTKPYNKDTKYKTIFMTWEDLPQQAVPAAQAS